ncbi:hypothetical protein RhiXN_11293 [Rhizoctonia solani]|uniref:Uncharacterized protein n=1 Tax=Rhizoctonia solani TaxID=456999 RepID=A0A8H8P5Q6_9AGAM|nr:uncharacterized protein RhiXN_11293 [Rhizoctonia solani]QRW24381.1 hypothetical protein RhiXN_11293 [Rhizoctonia solani]
MSLLSTKGYGGWTIKMNHVELANDYEPQTLAGAAEQNPPNTMEVDPPLATLVAGAKETAVGASSHKLPTASALADKPALRQVTGNGPPRMFAPPLPAGPSACRQYTRAGLTVPCKLTEACIQDLARGYTVEPQ